MASAMSQTIAMQLMAMYALNTPGYRDSHSGLDNGAFRTAKGAASGSTKCGAYYAKRVQKRRAKKGYR